MIDAGFEPTIPRVFFYIVVKQINALTTGRFLKKMSDAGFEPAIPCVYIGIVKQMPYHLANRPNWEV